MSPRATRVPHAAHTDWRAMRTCAGNRSTRCGSRPRLAFPRRACRSAARPPGCSLRTPAMCMCMCQCMCMCKCMEHAVLRMQHVVFQLLPTHAFTREPRGCHEACPHMPSRQSPLRPVRPLRARRLPARRQRSNVGWWTCNRVADLQLRAGPGSGKVVRGHHAVHDGAAQVLATIAEDVARCRDAVVVAQLVHPPPVEEVVLYAQVVEAHHVRMHCLCCPARGTVSEHNTAQARQPPPFARHTRHMTRGVQTRACNLLPSARRTRYPACTTRES